MSPKTSPSQVRIVCRRNPRGPSIAGLLCIRPERAPEPVPLSVLNRSPLVLEQKPKSFGRHNDAYAYTACSGVTAQLCLKERRALRDTARGAIRGIALQLHGVLEATAATRNLTTTSSTTHS